MKVENKEKIDNELKVRKEIIEHLGSNFILEAGAGAGKTTLIVERIINQIINSKVQPSEIVAITFTNNSANELKERIEAVALRKIGELKEADEEYREQINKLKSIDTMFIGTIHSFCELILRETPFVANLAPGFELIEEDEERFMESLWEQFVKYEKNTYKNEVEELKKIGINYWELKDTVFTLCKYIDVEIVKVNHMDIDAIKYVYNWIREQKDIYLQEQRGKLKKNGQDILEYIVKNEFSGNTLSNLRKEMMIYNLTEADLFKKKYIEEINEIEYLNKFKNCIVGINNYCYKITVDFLSKAVEHIYKRKLELNKVTFNDLLYKASCVIKSSDEAREHFRYKFKCFYVDEFQDTDPIQAEILLYLTHSGTEKPNQWIDCKPKNGSLFLVGDPKQSIYRFRRADIAIYNRVKSIIKGNGRVEELNINFRSTDEICNWVEETFKYSEEGKNTKFRFNKEQSDLQAAFNGMYASWNLVKEKDNSNNILAGVKKYSIVDNNDTDEKVIASIVKELVQGEKKIYVKDRKAEGTKLEKINYGNIMVLTKTNKEIEAYINEFKKQGIPVLLNGEKTLGNNTEIGNLTDLISFLADRQNEIKLVAVLKNCFGFKLSEIQGVKEELSKNKKKITQLMKHDENVEDERINFVFNKLKSYSSTLKKFNISTAIEEIVNDGVGVFSDRVYSTIELRDTLSALKQALEIIKNSKVNSISMVVELLQGFSNKKVKNELLINSEEAKSAVRIMTIHKAKGLESDVVILANCKSKNTSSNNNAICSISREEDGESLGYFLHYKNNGAAKGSTIFNRPPTWESRVKKEIEGDEAEYVRQLYVAATRAKSALIIANSKIEIDKINKKIEEENEEIEEENKKRKAENKQGKRKKSKLNYEQGYWYPLINNFPTNNQYKPIIRTSYNDNNSKLKLNLLEKAQIDKVIKIKEELAKKKFITILPSELDDDRTIGIVNNSEDDEQQSEDGMDIHEAKGRQFGTIVHRAFELMFVDARKNGFSFNEDNLREFAKIAAWETVMELPLTERQLKSFYSVQNKVKEIQGMVLAQGRNTIIQDLTDSIAVILRKFLENDETEKIISNVERYFVELPFSLVLDKETDTNLLKHLQVINKEKDNEESKVIVNGVMDLVIETKEGKWIIIDYKTNIENKDNIFKRKYSKQLIAYKYILEKLLNVAVDKMYLYSTYKNTFIEVQERKLQGLSLNNFSELLLKDSVVLDDLVQRIRVIDIKADIKASAWFALTMHLLDTFSDEDEYLRELKFIDILELEEKDIKLIKQYIGRCIEDESSDLRLVKETIVEYFQWDYEKYSTKRNINNLFNKLAECEGNLENKKGYCEIEKILV